MKQDLVKFYNELLKKYGPQGWWPLLSVNGSNPTKTGSIKGYHPNDYSFPKKCSQKFEICVGAILTQNTSWPQVEKALLNLNSLNLLSPEDLLDTKKEVIKELIKPAGYFNQKCEYILNFSEFFITLKTRIPSRQELLSVKGIGPETADSILLYAYKQPEFVVDAYTKRLFPEFKEMNYNQIKEIFESNLPRDYKLFQEFHALIVEHAKHSN